MIRFVLFALLLVVIQPSAAQTLNPGDIAIIGMNADNPDEFAIVALVDIPAGTEIRFSDNGWQAAGGFRGNEQTVVFAANATVAAGTVLVFDSDVPAFSTDGDQLFAYQGTDANPTFLYGLNNEGAGWQNDATSSNTSALPPGLQEGTTAVAVAEADNIAYSGTRTGTREELLAAIGNPANWTGNDETRLGFGNGFTVLGGGNANQPPLFTAALSSQTIQAGEAFFFTYEATDGDGDPLAFSLIEPPTGATIDENTGDFSWTPTEDQAGLAYTIRVSVSDGMAAAQTEADLTVASSAASTAPFFTSALPDTLIDLGEVLVYDYDAEDPDSEPVTLTLEEAPFSAALDASGNLTWTPDEVGVYVFTISASDGAEQVERRSVVGVQGELFPGLERETLRAALREAYAPDQTLGYDRGRDTLYAVIDLDADGYVRGIYTGFAKELTPGDPSIVLFDNGSSDGINAEHSWPQSMGASEEPARSDLHSLFPAKANVNSVRSNKPYGEIPDDETDGWYRFDESQSNIPTVEIDTWSESNEDYFEPRESVKGNLARAAMYFYTIYEDRADKDFLAAQIMNLAIWDGLDPADGAEVNRTEHISQYQGNVNPFILDPSLDHRAFDTGTVSAEDAAEVPRGIALSPAYPNPFNPQTTLTLSVDTPQHVEVAVYNVQGQRVRTLLDEWVPKRTQALTFNGKGLTSGVYFIVVVGQTSIAKQSVILFK